MFQTSQKSLDCLLCAFNSLICPGRFQNRWKTTQVVEAVIVTSTITELVESVVIVTPTRTLASLATATLRVNLPRQAPLRSGGGR